MGSPENEESVLSPLFSIGKSWIVSLLQFLSDLGPCVAASLCPQHACCFYKYYLFVDRDLE